jgi:general secretion pathway protein K
MKVPASERGAALLAVLAMVVLLAGFATVGLERLKAAGNRISDNQALSEARLLASSATATAATLVHGLKARLRFEPTLLNAPIELPSQAGSVTLRFAEGGNCFNLNALAAPQSTDPAMGRPRAAARPQDLARLLAAVGVPLLEANAVARATADRLAQTGQLWADASEWRALPGVTLRHWQLAGPLLCALPTREQATVNLNSLTATDAPILVGLGLGSDQARRAVSARPADGWPSSNAFLAGAASQLEDSGALADQLGTSTRWMRLTVIATTPSARVTRDVLFDTIQQPAELVYSRWRAAEIGVEEAS